MFSSDNGVNWNVLRTAEEEKSFAIASAKQKEEIAAAAIVAAEKKAKEKAAWEADAPFREAMQAADSYFHGIAEFSYGDFQKSRMHFSNALSIKPGFAEALSWRTECHRKYNDQDKATADCEAAEKIKPGMCSMKKELNTKISAEGSKDSLLYKELVRLRIAIRTDDAIKKNFYYKDEDWAKLENRS